MTINVFDKTKNKRSIICLFLGLLIILLSSCQNNTKQETFFYSMDTVISITLYNAHQENLDDIKKIYDEYHKYSDMHMEYSNMNNVYTINNSDDFVEIDEKLMELLEFANIDISGYNILIGEISILYKAFLEEENLEILNPELIQSLVDDMNNSILVFEENKVKIEGNAKIDLGSVAKGYATMKVKEYLKEKNIQGYLIDAGNSSLLLGDKNKNETFKIGLNNLRKTAFLRILNMKNTSITTSSTANQYVNIDGQVYHHIVNPHTGSNSYYYDIVTIIMDNIGLADILSTAIFNSNLETAKSIAKEYNAFIILVKDDEIIYESDEIRNYI